MNCPDPRPPSRRARVPARWCLLLAGLWLGLLCGPPAPAQDRKPPPLRLSGLVPAGVRTTATESWGTFTFNLTNLTATDRLARVLLSHHGRPDTQYGRDVWVPAHS